MSTLLTWFLTFNSLYCIRYEVVYEGGYEYSFQFFILYSGDMGYWQRYKSGPFNSLYCIPKPEHLRRYSER